MLWKKKSPDVEVPVELPPMGQEDLKSLREALILLSTKVERLEAKDQANSELRSVTNDRIQRLGEQIGEIKELFNVLSAEKKDLEVKVGQYNALVDRVNPANIAAMLRESEKRVIILDGQVELLKKKQDAFTERFQTFEKKLNYFKGEDALLEIQSQVKEDMQVVKRLCMTANTHASQVENRYVKINERVNSLTSLVDEMTQLRADLVVLRDDLQAKKATLESFRLDEHRLDEAERILGRLAQVIDDTAHRVDSRVTNVDIRLKLLERQQLGALASFLKDEQKTADHGVERIKHWLQKKEKRSNDPAPAQEQTKTP